MILAVWNVDVDVAAVFVGAAAVIAAINSWRAKRYAKSADRAVNNVPKGQRTLMQRVGDLEATQHWTAQAVCKIANGVGIDVDDPPEQERRTQ